MRGRSVAMLGCAGLLGGCEPGVLNPVGPIAGAERLILIDALAIMLAIVGPIVIAVPAIAWWFRSGNAYARRRPDWAYSGQVELLVWSVPALAVIFIAGIGWAGSHLLDPYRPIAGSQPPLKVEVVSFDWKWLFIYPGHGVASVNRLVLPAGRPVSFRLTSATVMNSFFVPRLGSQVYAMAGMQTRLALQADRPGRYRGLSANFSGKGFPAMAFAVEVVPPDRFARWAQRVGDAAPPLDRATYRALAAQGEAQPALYRASAGLFDAILRQSGTATRRLAADGRTR